MEPDCFDAIPLQVLYDILTGLRIDIADFMFNLCCNEPRAVMLYTKIHFLYHQSKQKFPGT